jgi:hypothetical protein
MHLPDPDSLSNEEWAMRVKELEYLRKQDKEKSSGLKLSR